MAYDKNGLRVTFNFDKPAGPGSNKTVITATYTNSSPAAFTGFSFLVAVPKYIASHVTPAASSVVPPNNSGAVTQKIELTNSQHGVKPLLMRMKVDYASRGVKVGDQAVCPAFPPGL